MRIQLTDAEQADGEMRTAHLDSAVLKIPTLPLCLFPVA